MVSEAGFRDSRIIKQDTVQTELEGEAITFYSITQRGFKFEKLLDRRCEDYGQTATYKGNNEGTPARFILDTHHTFETGRPTPVCENTARMLTETRLAKYFDVTKATQHFGLFPCGPTTNTSINNSTESKDGACGDDSCC